MTTHFRKITVEAGDWNLQRHRYESVESRMNQASVVLHNGGLS
jgi:hypothetical protein